MILCENHLNVWILASSKYDCSTDEGGVLIEKMSKCFFKGCVRSCCNKMIKTCDCFIDICLAILIENIKRYILDQKCVIYSGIKPFFM